MKEKGLPSGKHGLLGGSGYINVRERRTPGYELFGSIAVIECEPGEAKRLADSVMRSNRRVLTVLRKGGAVSGRYRTRKFLYVSGAKDYVANYRENNCVFVFDIRKVFFSTKLGYERKRVSDLVRDGEKVVVMFAGVGPFAIEIAKEHRKCSVVAMELNAAACRYMRQNAILNKTHNVTVEQGDASKLAGKYANFADRIIMPLPKEAENFIPSALSMSKRKCTFHYYTFSQSGKSDTAIRRVRKLLEANGKRFRLLGYRTVRPYSAVDEELAIDFVAH